MSVVIRAESWSKGGPEAVRETPWNVDRVGPGTFRYQGRRWTFDDVIVSDTLQSPCVITPRSPARTDDQHYTTVFFIAEGLFILNDTSIPEIFKAGSAGWVPGWSQVPGEIPVPTRFIGIGLHDRVLERHGTTLPTRTGRIDSRNLLLTPTLAFLHTFTSDPASASLPAGHPTGTLIADLITALLPRTTPEPVRRSVPDLYETALIIIRRQYSDPELDPRTLAGLMNVSLRQLQRSFAKHDQTVSAAITHERLTAAITALHTGTPPESLAGLAYLVGMSLKELRHAAKTAYGLTPRQLRATPSQLLNGID
ncbi:hypothetical protein B7R21_07830 [Subtercola boreus]|uniref:HTH araC/xylS-type domain-containing protein n=1 Tax=Subtercola boreus TaxID=120213 RepID=A0A3E0VUJ6_9MICO|nr:helix-turn-helix domain-containing protein [Subtercola boreus]RFA13734.1 hypothetical protein B7R21_07830 [Subtercola boreus]